MFFVPTLAPCIPTEKEQELAAGRLDAAMLIVLPPAFAVILPAQLLLRLLGVATTKPAGNVSLIETLLNANAEFGFASVKVREVIPLKGIAAAPKTFVIVGANGVGTTARLAVLLVLPGPLSVAEIGPVVLLSVPGVPGAFTLTEIRQAFEGGLNIPPTNPMDDEPAIAVTVPPQELVRPFGEAKNKPLGKLSVKAIPVSAMFAFRLLMVKLNVVISSCTIVAGAKTLLIVGGAITVRLADVALPVPPLVELTPLMLLT